MDYHIIWHPDPTVFSIDNVQFSWYGLMFVTGLFGAYLMTLFTLSKENISDRAVFLLFMSAYVGAIIGARLGHCFFYKADYYTKHWDEVLYFWKGGLSSHGAVLGICLAVWMYARRALGMAFLAIGDRIVAPIALVAGFVRLGNLMNSEIIGKASQLPWAFVFRKVDGISRHPVQLYEALAYFSLAYFLWQRYHQYGGKQAIGQVSGLFFVLMFSFRFLVEFLKENHAAFEDQFPLNMGQMLSLPLVLSGLFMLWKNQKASK